MMCDKLGYVQVNNNTVVVKPTPAGLFGLVVVSGGNVNVYDNAATSSGTVLFSKSGMAAGDVVHFGGNGIAANNGLVVVSTGVVNVLYT